VEDREHHREALTAGRPCVARTVFNLLACDAEPLSCVAGGGQPLDERSVRAPVPDGAGLECEAGPRPVNFYFRLDEQ
jgi:hypothetical protein